MDTYCLNCGERAARCKCSRKLRCAGCGRPYSKGPDLIIPDEAWMKIAPRSDGGGVLCPNCIHDRLEAAGFAIGSVPARFTSGPMACVDEQEPRPAASASGQKPQTPD